MMVFISNEKPHVSAYSGHHQVLTTLLLLEFYIICLNRVAMLRSHHHLRAFVKLILVGCLCVSGYVGSWVWMMMRSQHCRSVWACYIKLV